MNLCGRVGGMLLPMQIEDPGGLLIPNSQCLSLETLIARCKFSTIVYLRKQSCPAGESGVLIPVLITFYFSFLSMDYTIINYFQLIFNNTLLDMLIIGY